MKYFLELQKTQLNNSNFPQLSIAVLCDSSSNYLVKALNYLASDFNLKLEIHESEFKK